MPTTLAWFVTKRPNVHVTPHLAAAAVRSNDEKNAVGLL